MALLGFKEQFVEAIRSGEKTHTIRGVRKVPIKVGETLYLYGKVRQRGMYRIVKPVTCTRIQSIWIGRAHAHTPVAAIHVDDAYLAFDERTKLALADGFASHAAMVMFWLKNNRLPFTGQIIHWKAGAHE